MEHILNQKNGRSLCLANDRERGILQGSSSSGCHPSAVMLKGLVILVEHQRLPALLKLSEWLLHPDRFQTRDLGQ